MDAKLLLRWIPIFALLLAPAIAAQEPERHWRAGDRGEGPGFAYQVYSSQQEGEAFPRYEVRGRVSAAPETLLHAMRRIVADPERAPKGQTRRVLQSNEGEFVVHTFIDLPALFSDRDIVTRGVSSHDGESLRVDWQASAHPDAPRRAGVVRIERSGGFWTFEPSADGVSQVVYATYVDVAGALPRWLVRPLTEGNVARVFEQVAVEAIQFATAVPVATP